MTNKGIGNIKDYTPHFKLIIPRFNAATWHDFIESNFRSIDALLFNMFGINNFVGEWKQITTYNVGDVIFVGEDLLENGIDSEYSGRLVKVLKQHTTDDSNYFNIFYSLHQDYYELFFDANNAEYFSEKAFEYKNEANNYLKASQELNTLYQQYLADTQTARDNAQISANSAATSEQNAKIASNTAVNTVKTATDLLNFTQDYTNQAINTINTTKTEAVNTITITKDQTVQEIDTKLAETNQIIDEKITIVQDNLDTTITEAIIAAKDEVQEEADTAIDNAAEEAATFAKEKIITYVEETTLPPLQDFVDIAETYKNDAQTSAKNAQNFAINSQQSAQNALISEQNSKNYENITKDLYNNTVIEANNAKISADLVQEALSSITGVYRVKGSVQSYTNLPISGEIGDVYNILDTGANYVWTEFGWDKLSETIDLSIYYTQTETDNLLNTKQNIITDLDNIRTGAQLGSTALQNFTETDPIYIADKPNLATKTDLDTTVKLTGDQDISGTKTFKGTVQVTINTISATSGTVSLAVNKIYTISVSGATTFSLPTPSNTNIFNQIKLIMKVTGTPTINWGTTRFFNKKTPKIKAGNYDVYFDYDNLLGAWVCGAMAKGTAS